MHSRAGVGVLVVQVDPVEVELASVVALDFARVLVDDVVAVLAVGQAPG